MTISDILVYHSFTNVISFFFFNASATTELYTYLHTLPLHDALPILPCAAYRIGQMPFELGCIESAFAGQFLPAIFRRRHARFDHRSAQPVLGLVPILVRAVTLVRAQRELDLVSAADVLVDPVGHLAEALDLLHDLVLGAEDKLGRASEG